MTHPLPKPGVPDVAYLVDLSSIARGLFHVIPPSQTADGEPVAVTAAVTQRLVNILVKLRPAFLGVCADGATEVGDQETSEAARLRRYWRAALWPSYKAGREPPGPEYDTQIDRLIDICGAHRIPVFRRTGFEADDFFGALVPKLRRLGLRVVILSKDHDLWQLVGPGVAAWDGDLGGELTVAADVVARYGVPPAWLPAVLALSGDGDEAPGLPGIADARAAQLLQRHAPKEGPILDARGLLERVLLRWQWEATASGKPSKVGIALRDGGELARLSLRLVELREENVPVELDLAELRVGWGDDDAQRVRALGAELSIAVLRECRGQPKRPLGDAVARRWMDHGLEDDHG